MNGVDGQHHLSQVELGHLLRQPVLKLTEQSQQIPTHIVVHDQVLERHGDRQRQRKEQKPLQTNSIYGVKQWDALCRKQYKESKRHHTPFSFFSQYHYYGAPERFLTFEGFPKNRCLGGQRCIFSQPWGVFSFKHLLWECGKWNDRQLRHLH